MVGNNGGCRAVQTRETREKVIMVGVEQSRPERPERKRPETRDQRKRAESRQRGPQLSEDVVQIFLHLLEHLGAPFKVPLKLRC